MIKWLPLLGRVAELICTVTMIATSGFLTALQCTKFVFGWEMKGTGGTGPPLLQIPGSTPGLTFELWKDYSISTVTFV